MGSVQKIGNVIFVWDVTRGAEETLAALGVDPVLVSIDKAKRSLPLTWHVKYNTCVCLCVLQLVVLLSFTVARINPVKVTGSLARRPAMKKAVCVPICQATRIMIWANEVRKHVLTELCAAKYLEQIMSTLQRCWLQHPEPAFPAWPGC